MVTDNPNSCHTFQVLARGKIEDCSTVNVMIGQLLNAQTTSCPILIHDLKETFLHLGARWRSCDGDKLLTEASKMENWNI